MSRIFRIWVVWIEGVWVINIDVELGLIFLRSVFRFFIVFCVVSVFIFFSGGSEFNAGFLKGFF